MAAIAPQDSFTRFVNDMRWIEAHYEELRGLYPDEYVAVVDGKVVRHEADMESLLAQLRPT